MKFTIKAKFIRVFIVTVILSIFTSCTSLYLKKDGFLAKKPKLKVIANDTKHLIFLPIIHIGKKEYYNDVSKKIDSLTQLDYTVFYEGIDSNLDDKEKIIELLKKYRKIQGNVYPVTGYLQKFYPRNNRLGLINQPKRFKMGIDTLTAINVDITLVELISQFEMGNGEVKLNKCDINTNLDDVYRCKTLGKKAKQNFIDNYILGMRDTHLAKVISKSESKKIFVIYGSCHYEGLLEELRKIDTNWKELLTSGNDGSGCIF